MMPLISALFELLLQAKLSSWIIQAFRNLPAPAQNKKTSGATKKSAQREKSFRTVSIYESQYKRVLILSKLIAYGR